MGVGETGVGEMGQIIGEMGVGETGVGETGTNRPIMVCQPGQLLFEQCFIYRMHDTGFHSF